MTKGLEAFGSLSWAAPPPGLPLPVVYLDWEKEFIPWLTGKLGRIERDGRQVRLAKAWAPGMHMALIGKTGEGKTTFAVGILQVRKYVLALDPKGEDETLAASGFRRILTVPKSGDETILETVRRWVQGHHRPSEFPREIQRDLEDGSPVRLIVGGASDTRRDDEKLRALLADCLEYVRASGGWTLYADEYQVLSDMRMFKLGPMIERLLISARRKRTSVVTAYQAPAWVPKAATRQARIIVAWKTNDRDMIQAIAQAAGRDWHAVKAAMEELPPFHALVIPDDIRAPMMITAAPKIN